MAPFRCLKDYAVLARRAQQHNAHRELHRVLNPKSAESATFGGRGLARTLQGSKHTTICEAHLQRFSISFETDREVRRNGFQRMPLGSQADDPGKP